MKTVNPKNYGDIRALGASEGRKVDSLIALDNKSDPYAAGGPARFDSAMWFADLWSRFKLNRVHTRFLHYKLVSQATPVLMLDGTPYENTVRCSHALDTACRDARYLGLVPFEAIIDRRSPPPTLNCPDDADEAAQVETVAGDIEISDFGTDYQPPTLTLPSLMLNEPVVSQRYQIEIWIEKTTMNDILLPLGREYGVNICTTGGEPSATACKALVGRAIQSGKPVRIFYISDFDPAGRSMPVAAARKIEFLIAMDSLDLDIRLVPIALTPEQCTEYNLPRTPIKETEQRAEQFERRFGTGASELDALEATHPGLLHDILVAEIKRYYDSDLDANVRATICDVEEELEAVTGRIIDLHADEIAELDEQRRAIDSTFRGVADPALQAFRRTMLQAQKALDRTLDGIRSTISKMEADFIRRAEPVIAALNSELEGAAPEAEDFDWPWAAEADEYDDDPLFDTARSYLSQIARYKMHQGKADVITTLRFVHNLKCEVCGKDFPAVRSSSAVCSGRCRNRRWLDQHPDYRKVKYREKVVAKRGAGS